MNTKTLSKHLILRYPKQISGGKRVSKNKIHTFTSCFTRRKKNLSTNAWFDKFYMILILIDGQKSRGQMSAAVQSPAVKCQLRSKVPWSNVSCGQKSPGQKLMVVNCLMVRWSFGQTRCNLLIGSNPWHLFSNLCNKREFFVYYMIKLRAELRFFFEKT